MSLISVVIPALRLDQHLKSCLESLVNQKNANLEVWVVFNPTLPKINLSYWPNWIHFIKSRKGVNCARNLGLAKSTSDFVLFLDSDCQLTNPEHVVKMIEFINCYPMAAGVGGIYEIASNSNIVTKAYHYLQMDWLKKQIIGEDFSARSLIGGHMLLRKSKLADLKFDEKIIFGGSEKEFFIRLLKKNAKLYLNLQMSVLHNSEISKKELLSKAMAQGQGEKYINSQHGFPETPLTRYIVKQHLNDELASPIDDYRRVFSKYASHKNEKINCFKKIFYSALEQINVAQSSKD